MKTSTFRVYSNQSGTILETTKYHFHADDLDTIELNRVNLTTKKHDTFINPVLPDVAYTFKKHADVVNPENALLAYFADLYDVAFVADDCIDDTPKNIDDCLDTLAKLDVAYIDLDDVATSKHADDLAYIDDLDDCLDCLLADDDLDDLDDCLAYA